MTNMDTKDKRIILELDRNSRQSYSRIAKSAGLSKEAVRLRIKKLEDKGIIEGYYALINFSLLRQNLYLIYLKTAGMSNETEKDFIKKINNIKNVGLNSSVLGFANFNLAIWSENSYEFEKTFKKILSGHEEYIIKKIIMIESFAHYFKIKQFANLASNTKALTTQNFSEPETLDNTDYLLLRELSSNANVSATKLSELTNLTSPAILKRIKRLEDKKMILGYKVQVNLNMLHAKIFLKLKDMSEKSERKLIAYLGELPEVVSVSKTYGDYDLEFRVQVNDVLKIELVIDKIKMDFTSNFLDFDMLIFTKFHKVLNYFPG